MIATMTKADTVNSRLSSLARTRMNRDGSSSEFYVLVGNTGGEVNLLDSDEAEALRIFRHGSCLAFAYAVSLITEFPVAFFTVGGRDEPWEGHAAVLLPTGDYLDIAGVSSLDEINSYFKFAGDAAVPSSYESSEAGHIELVGSPSDGGLFEYLLTNVNELGLLVTLHFAEQLLSYYDLSFNVERLRAMEKDAVTYARKKRLAAKA